MQHRNNFRFPSSSLLTFKLSLLYKKRVAYISNFPPKQPRVAFSLPYLFIELFYVHMPVVRTDGRTYGYVITKISRMGRLPDFLRYGATLARAWSSAANDAKKTCLFRILSL